MWNRCNKNILSRILFAQELRARINKDDFIKPKSSCTVIEIINPVRRKPTEWDRLFASYVSVYNVSIIYRVYYGFKRSELKIQMTRTKMDLQFQKTVLKRRDAND